MDEQLAQLDAIYDLPWNRIGPYLVGAISGYILVIKLNGKLNLSRVCIHLKYSQNRTTVSFQIR